MTEIVFACFDVETTRLDPSAGRIIEIAVVRIDGQGRPVGEWTTLIDPATADLGRTDIHGIHPSWLADAPAFLDIAGDLVGFLNGCVPVAHNAGFDRGFLCAEWERAGLGPLNIDVVDTLGFARGLGLPGRLGQLADALDVAIGNAHTALGDSRALAQVLLKLIGRLADPFPLPHFDSPLLSPPPSGRVTHRPVSPT